MEEYPVTSNSHVIKTVNRFIPPFYFCSINGFLLSLFHRRSPFFPSSSLVGHTLDFSFLFLSPFHLFYFYFLSFFFSSFADPIIIIISSLSFSFTPCGWPLPIQHKNISVASYLTTWATAHVGLSLFFFFTITYINFYIHLLLLLFILFTQNNKIYIQILNFFVFATQSSSFRILKFVLPTHVKILISFYLLLHVYNQNIETCHKPQLGYIAFCSLSFNVSSLRKISRTMSSGCSQSEYKPITYSLMPKAVNTISSLEFYSYLPIVTPSAHLLTHCLIAHQPLMTIQIRPLINSQTSAFSHFSIHFENT
ncbi:Uncharacterized protein TCM_022410 [Theobroma cacao]|uniref:Uncharacterized protein n=1 Tax=Theobroma cacao TaxID=3641 RepID=A0A061ESR5_THECC|nr:Uncharacterized protein TCM_022410 [Theobroma cacao]